MMLRRRLQRLEAQFPPRRALVPIAEVAPEWQELASRNHEAREHAVALFRRHRELWPNGEVSSAECWDDDICCGHLLWLEVTKAGDLETFFFEDADDAT
jgi:hypothetical protein